MRYTTFIGEVHHRAHLPPAKAVTATRAALTTLAETINPHDAADLAAQLPRELGQFLTENVTRGPESVSFGEFCHRVATREHCEVPVATSHARCVMEVLGETVSPDGMNDIRSHLPPEFQTLFGPAG